MKNIQVIISDLDGTLFYDGEKNNPILTEENKNAIIKWLKQGKRFMLASGRTGVMVDDFKEKYDLDIDMIACNGGKIIIDKKTVYQSRIPKEVIQKVIELLKPYQDEVDFMLDMEHKFKVALRQDSLISQHFNPDNYPVYLAENYIMDEAADLPCKIFMVIKDEARQPFFFELLNQTFKDELKITRSSSTTLELCNSGISKGTALLKMIELLDLDPETIMVVGDEENDIELFNTAKNSAVMAHARPSIKALADEEVVSVAALIHKYL